MSTIRSRIAGKGMLPIESTSITVPGSPVLAPPPRFAASTRCVLQARPGLPVHPHSAGSADRLLA